jgi:hypothetical protein
MYLWVEDHAFVDDLCAHYRRSGFTAERAGGGMVEIRRPDAPDEGQERREVLAHLRVWGLLQPTARVEPLAR